MQESHVFEYATMRVVPRIEREEFLNVGVVLYCPKQKFLKAMILIDEDKLAAFSSELDIIQLERNLCAFEQICNGDKEGGPIATLDIASRFRWLTATRSTIVQASKVHPGLCTDALKTLNRLFNQLVV